MKTFYIRDAVDVPHRFDPLNPDRTVCGLDMDGMQAITDLQALVYLAGRSCTGCTPTLAGRTVHIRQRRAAA